jgi:microcystin-dependent protein
MNASFRMKMTVPIGTRSQQKGMQTLGELMSIYKEDISLNDQSGELFVNGAPKIQFFKNYLMPYGVNGTPNLYDRFVIAAGSGYNVGAIGGATSQSITLTTLNMPAHTHTLEPHSHGITDPGHLHGYSYLNPLGANAADFYSGDYWSPGTVYASTTYNTTGITINNSATLSTSTSGSGNAFSVTTLPPYYALCYIMKL